MRFAIPAALLVAAAGCVQTGTLDGSVDTPDDPAVHVVDHDNESALVIEKCNLTGGPVHHDTGGMDTAMPDTGWGNCPACGLG